MIPQTNSYVCVCIHTQYMINDKHQYVNRLTTRLLFSLKIRERGWPRASLINLGGGLNIRLSGGHGKGEEDSENLATPQKLVGAVLPLLPEGTTLLLEPGRSLVATAGEATLYVI